MTLVLCMFYFILGFSTEKLNSVADGKITLLVMADGKAIMLTVLGSYTELVKECGRCYTTYSWVNISTATTLACGITSSTFLNWFCIGSTNWQNSGFITSIASTLVLPLPHYFIFLFHITEQNTLVSSTVLIHYKVQHFLRPEEVMLKIW